MTMELEGNLSLERAHTRRWVSVIGVIIPVAAIVLLAAWFVRVYVVPPTIVIPEPMIVADDPPAPVAVVRREIEAPQPATAIAKPAAPPPSGDRPAPASALPMFATLAIVPPTLNSTPRPFADPAQDIPRVTPSITVEQPAAQPSAEPIAGPIPLPRTKPHGSLALVTGAIPLPRPRPADSAPPLDDLPAVDRHGIP
jgi:hypothetical protein